MKKYKLLKDLPGKKAGEIIHIFQHDKLVKWYDKNNYEICVDVNNPEWFEEVKENKYYRCISVDEINYSGIYSTREHNGVRQYFRELTDEEKEKYKFGFQFEYIEGIGYVLKETKGYCDNTASGKLKNELLEELSEYFEKDAAKWYGRLIKQIDFCIERDMSNVAKKILEELKEQPTTEPTLQLYKIGENIYSDGCTFAGKMYKVELIGSGYENKKPDIDKMLKDLQMIKPIIFENFSNAESLHTDLEKEMSGKVIRGILNGAEVSEQWINVNNAVIIAKKYMEKVKSSFSTLSDTEKEIIEDLRKAKETGAFNAELKVIRDLRKAKDDGDFIAIINFLRQVFNDAKDGMIHSETK